MSRHRWIDAKRYAAVVAVAAIPALVTAAACNNPATSSEARTTAESTDASLAVAWNGLAYEIAYAADSFMTFKGQRALAMVHLAMHDALQAVLPIYHSYLYDERHPDADPYVAAAQAAADILRAAYPDRSADIDRQLAKTLDATTDRNAREEGQAVGAAAAGALLAARAGDGWDASGAYQFGGGPGAYATTPPWDGFVLQPGFGHATHFTFDDPARFRPPPPPPLDSPEYAQALNEVMAQGDSASSARSADQTGYALWWMEFSESAAGRLVRRLLAESDLSLWDANRVLAHLYAALYDGYVTVWEAKYTFNHWRPYTAIRAAANDGNPDTSPDPDWVPLRPTPPFPEYMSAHATGCATAYEVATRYFGDNVAFENTSLTAPPGMSTRTFESFRDAAEECADSRVQLGWHFRYATNAGLDAGRRIARFVMDSTLRAR